MTTPDRSARLELRLTPEERDHWHALAAAQGVSVAELVREAVRRYSPEEAELADLGRAVLRVAERRRR